MKPPRCTQLDSDGCRCLREARHNGPHDFPWTPWLSVLVLRQKREAAP